MRDWAHSRRLGTPADEAGYVALRQPPASNLASLFRIDVLRGKTGLTTQENECEKGKLRLRENRRSRQISPRHWTAATNHAWVERGGSVRKPRGSGAAASGRREPGAAARVRRPP